MSLGIHTAQGLRTSAGSAVGTNPFSVGKSGLVPAPTAADSNKVLKGNGTWADAGIMLTGTLIAGQTEITFNSDAITESSFLTFFTDKFGVGPESASATTGSVTLTFETQEQNLEVGVKVE